MYDLRPNLIIGFHGCEASVRDSLLKNPDEIVIGKKKYDWLGNGMYFWENNYERALKWAEDKQKRSEIKEPAVIGAVLHLGICCDLLDSKYIHLVKRYYTLMAEEFRKRGIPLPVNRDVSTDPHKDRLLRELDCATIEFMHSSIFSAAQKQIEAKGVTDIKIFETTRGVFTEGGFAYSGAGFFEKNHIQICVRNFNCIKGFFLPRKEIDFLDYLKQQRDNKA